jgi:hypothetical protein
MSSSIDDNVKFVYKGQDVFGEVTVKLDGDFSNYPFVDTMCFLSKNKNTLSNLPDKEGYQLHSVYGDCNQCDDCDGNIILRSGWSGDKYLCNNCAQGHQTLKELDVETKWNKKISD